MHQNIGERGPEKQLAYDWALFQTVEAGTGAALFRCWQISTPVVVLGRNGVAADEVIEAACLTDGVSVLRRFSGGGTVVLGPGMWNYAVALPLVSRPALVDVRTSVAIVLQTVVAALGVAGLAVVGGDITFRGRKVSGNAQRRGRHALLHHGTVLYDFDAALATRYLKEPRRQPSYRRGRRHADFLTNLPLPGDEVFAALQATCRALCGRSALRTVSLQANPDITNP